MIPVMAMVWSCSDKASPDLPVLRETEEGTEHEMIVLGEQLEDPYSVENISKAVASLYPALAPGYSVTTTDLYVRFLPENDEEFARLEELGVLLLDHPVDYEIIREGDYYHDPQIPEDDITWQYAVVGNDFEFPEGIRYEILEKCHISEHAPVTRGSVEEMLDWDLVEKEAFRLTGNEALYCQPTKGEAYKPSGRIAIVDESLDDEPFGVKGVKVSCNSFVKFASAYTDEEGYYNIATSFNSSPRYRLIFKNKKGFAIGMNLLLVSASVSTMGRHSQAGFNTTITRKSDRKLFTRAVVNNACYDYYTSCKTASGSISAPPANLRIWLFRNLSVSSAVMMRQGTFIDGTLIGELLGEYSLILKMFLPDITLGLKDKDDYASIYAEAIHECAHASHFMQVGRNYWEKYIKFIVTSYVTNGGMLYGAGTENDKGYCEVAEMWAYYMQTRFYRDRYPESATSFGTSYWFSPQILFYLDERGITRFRLFPCLSADIHDRLSLQARLLSLYPEYKTTINQAFNRYL